MSALEKTRAAEIIAMVEQAFIEGAYKHFSDHKDAVTRRYLAQEDEPYAYENLDYTEEMKDFWGPAFHKKRKDHYSLNAEFAMRTKAHKFKNILASLAINQHQIMLDVAVAEPFPFSFHAVIHIPGR